MKKQIKTATLLVVLATSAHVISASAITHPGCIHQPPFLPLIPSCDIWWPDEDPDTLRDMVNVESEDTTVLAGTPWRGFQGAFRNS